MDTLTVNEKIYLLEHIDDPTLISLCKVNKEMNSLCNEAPYSERIFNDRSEKYLADYIQHKPVNMKWKEFYIRVKSVLNHIKNGTVPEFRKYENFDEMYLRDAIIPDHPEIYKLINVYTYNGNLFEVKFLHKITNEYPDPITVELVVEIGNFEMFKWLYENDIKSNESFLYASQNGNIDIMEFIYERNPDQDYATAVRYAAERENLKALKWFAQRGYYPLNSHFDNAVIDGNMSIINWGLENRYLTQIRLYAYNTLKERNERELLELLQRNNVEIVQN